MLRNTRIRTVAGDCARQWFSDDYFDLIVWYGPDRQARVGFQLCYDKGGHERAVTWLEDKGFQHHAVDDGEPDPFTNATPILRPDGGLPLAAVVAEFQTRAAGIDAEIRAWVLAVLQTLSGAVNLPPRRQS